MRRERASRRNEIAEDRDRVSKLLEEERENKTLSVERRVETEKSKQIERAKEKVEDLNEDIEQNETEVSLRVILFVTRETLRTQRESRV